MKMSYFDGMKIVGVSHNHEILFLGRISMREYVVVHCLDKEKASGQMEIRIGPLENLRNKQKITREACGRNRYIIVTESGVLVIPHPINHEAIKTGKERRPIFNEGAEATFMEMPIRALFWDLNLSEPQ